MDTLHFSNKSDLWKGPYGKLKGAKLIQGHPHTCTQACIFFFSLGKLKFLKKILNIKGDYQQSALSYFP